MSRNVPPFPPFRWSGRAEEAAQRVATRSECDTDEAIAASLGMSDRQLHRWRQHPEFAARVQQHVEAQRAALIALGIAIRENRVGAQNTRWLAMQQLIQDRAADPTMTAPGHATGLLVRTYRSVGKGEDFQLHEEYTFDAALVRELRELEKHVATELGQWTEKREHSGEIQVQRIVEVEVAMPLEVARGN